MPVLLSTFPQEELLYDLAMLSVIRFLSSSEPSAVLCMM